MSRNDFNIELYAYSNTSATFQPMCEWRVLFSLNYDVKVDITRDLNHYEEIYMYTNQNSEWGPRYSKEFANCQNVTQTYTFHDTGYIRFRVNKLNDLSDYKITAYQDTSEDNVFPIIVMVVIVLSMVIMVAM